ncbi:hypothetical protein AVEN_70252-1 [Araneus ventricosus]|uniref:Uncharacterized protein n=1 Tax=Araneus ventricosus TaxID=182803 RepID=A0A4Y2GD55_ARAVE|nr:hypothetical protein AVEN_70252-1 [Araneus ventricosus]
MAEIDSSIEFCGDLMEFVTAYFNVSWSRPEETRGRPLPFIRFTRNHAKFIQSYLDLKAEFWEMLEDSPFLNLNEASFLRFALLIKEDTKCFAYSTCNFLLFATFISSVAALATKRGFFNAPEYAMVVIYDAISSFHLRREISFSNSVKDTTTRRIL